MTPDTPAGRPGGAITERSERTMTTRYEGSFRWGRQGEANVPCELTKNEAGWFCDSINGQRWVYGPPTDPFGGWGGQCAKPTALEAVRSFLRQWDACGTDPDYEGDPGDDPGTICRGADHLTIREVSAVEG